MAFFYKNFNYCLKSTKSEKLTSKNIKEICYLKDKHWKFGIKSQIKWFKKNIKEKDVHNLFYIKSDLVGYTVLREKTLLTESPKTKSKYFLFDTFIIDPKQRNKGYAKLLMNFNNLIIERSGFFSFLICDNKIVNFYLNFKWKKLRKKYYEIVDFKSFKNAMIFNKTNFDKKYLFYIHK